ncbi:SIMPL domain-containing protein [Aquabacterium sp.]|uniref:SIMPL domain-containing protein n=1 Tax=Aquabacterium sp. TaxID=1872578 RepID=UPI0035B24032
MNTISSVWPVRSWVCALVSALALVGATAAHAEEARQNVLTFQSTATQEFTQDLMTVTLQVTREGTQAADVQTALKQVLDGALKEARGAAVADGGLEVRTGTFHVYPRYGSSGRIVGWQGSAQLVLQGTDTTRIAQTAGRLTQLNVVNVGYGLSRGLRERNESALTSQAIAQFRERAAQLSREFGFKSYALGEVAIQSGEAGMEARPVMMAVRAKSVDMADAPLPVEPGKGSMSVTVSGQIVLKP